MCRWEQEKARRGVRKASKSSSEKSEGFENEEKEKINADSSATQNENVLGENDREDTSLSKSDSLEDVENKDLDTEKNKKSVSSSDEGTGIDEPEEVSFAREEISTLIAEEKRTSNLKADLQGKLQQTRKEVEALEELLPKKISSEENREILGLLCKVHELEITNAELQSHSLLRENLLRHKDLEMNKFESRQRLCDEIIQMQRAAINGKPVGNDCPKVILLFRKNVRGGALLTLTHQNMRFSPSSFKSAPEHFSPFSSQNGRKTLYCVSD